MSNRQVTYTINLNGNVLESLKQTEQYAMRVDSIFNTIKNTMIGIGVGYGARELLSIGKDWLQASADYETAMLRIKNVSSSVSEGLKNQQFILSEVEKFKIPLQEATDSYGKFLVMISNSHLASEQVRKLHDEVLLISKITAMPQSSTDAAIRDIGIMLGEGVLEARHLRALSYVFPQIIPFLARDLMLGENGLKGVVDKNISEDTATQRFSKLISSGKLTKSALDSRIILQAIEEYSKSLSGKLPEALNTQQSALNELGNEWLKFKLSLAGDLRPEIIALIHDLQDGAGWLKEHKEQIESIGTVIIHVGEAYALWKASQLGVAAVQTIVNLAVGKNIASISAETGAISIQTEAITGLTLAINELIMAQQAAAVTAYEMLTAEEAAAGAAAETAGVFGLTNSVTMASSGAAVGLSAAGIGASVASALSTITLGVGIVYIVGSVLEEMFPNLKKQDEMLAQRGDLQTALNFAAGGDNLRLREFAAKNKDYLSTQDALSLLNAYRNSVDADRFDQILRVLGVHNNPNGSNYDNTYYQDMTGNTGDYNQNLANKYGVTVPVSQSSKGGNVHVTKIPTSEGVKGNSITNIDIKINELNGIKSSTFTVKNQNDLEHIKDVVGDEVARLLTDAVNDSQLVRSHH